MLVDLHSHTTFSDGRSTHQEMVDAATAAGIAVYGISDHYCFHDNFWTTKPDKLAILNAHFAQLKEHNRHLKLLYGMEVDYVPHCEQRVAELKQRHGWDYIIGSVHYLGDWNIDSNAEDWEGKDVDATYDAYLRLLEQMVDTHLYNVVGHIDLPKKYGHYATSGYLERYEAIGRKLRDANMAYEINTAGRIKPCAEFYPRLEVVKLFCDMGVDVTLGSDAHHADNVGQYFTEAAAMLRSVGYQSICYFEQGSKVSVAL